MSQKQKSSLTPQQDPIKQRNLLLIQNESKLTTLKQQIQNISQELTNTKDIMRKYRQKSMPQLVSDVTWQNNAPSVYVLNSGNFYHELPINKLVQYFQGRVDMLTKSRNKKEAQMKKILTVFVEWLKSKKIGAVDLSIEVRNMVMDYMQELEDNQQN